MKRISTLLSVVLLVVMVIFAIQNLESVDVQFLVFSLSMPKILLILLVYLLGMVSGWGLIDVLKKAFQNLSSKPIEPTK
ncbi:MAG: DUF1049 domain-containing protein [Planctomycetia bacterium]|nr:DUF1049 domain-containing protein [Planctomycetia bacterium]